MTLRKLLLYLKGKKGGRRAGGREPWAIFVAVVLTVERRSPAWGLKGKPSTERKVNGPSFGESFLGASWDGKTPGRESHSVSIV